MEKVKNKKIICFDLDDTLMNNQYRFEEVYCSCIKTIINALGMNVPQVSDILDKFKEIENYKWKQWGKKDLYRPMRLTGSWTETYEFFADKFGLEPRQHIKELLSAQVMTIHDPPYILIPGAIETLIELKNRQYHMELITLGDTQIQRRKIDTLNLEKYFYSVHIPSTDKYGVLKQLATKYGHENIVMIGNSMRSDINPALLLDIDAIYIPRGAWDISNAAPTNSKYTKLNKVEEILNIFNK